LLGNIVGKDFIAVHMIWGAANEWSAVAAYNRLADLEKHPVLAELLRRIAKQEARHVAFYATQARERLGKSKKAQVLARFALKNAWGPVGSSIMGPEEVNHVMSHIFSGEEGLREIRKLDEHISRMPGLEGLTIVETSMKKYGVAA
ncbi:MAG: ferritin-like domain-containing protein, partial [Rhodoglobus sp.]